MRRFATRGQQRTKCPMCGGEIIVSDLFQYSHDFKLTKSGRLSLRYTHSNVGTEEVRIANCKCGANWGVSDFEIDSDGFFIDYKYRSKEEEH